MSKAAEILQRPEESPTELYERLCEVYTLFDPKAQENQRMVSAAFVAQSFTDICRKLQKLEGFARMNATQPIEVANKVFVNHDQEAQKVADKWMKQKVSLLAATTDCCSSMEERN